METLTDEQNNALSRFQEFTHFDSIDTCRQYLIAHEWDVQRAIETALVSSSDLPPSQEINQRFTTDIRTTVPSAPIQYVNLPATNNRDASIFHSILSFFFSIIFKILPFLQGVLHLFVSFFRSLFLTTRQVDPNVEIDEYCTYFDQKYGNQHPALYRGRLIQALRDAQREVRLLFIYIHDKNSQQCDRFCREILCGEAFQSIIGNNLIWSCSTDTQEGGNASRSLDAYSYPCFCIVAHHGSQQTVQLKLDRYSDSDEFLAEVINAVQLADETLEYNRQQRNSSNSRSQLLEEQNQAYLDSLRADEEKAEKRKREELERLKQEEDLRKLEEEKQKKLQEFTAFRDRFRSSIPEEPAANENDVIQVSIRLPSSEPIRRRFRRSDPVKSLFEFAWTDPNVPDQFELLWGYPRKRYQYDQIGETILNDVMTGKTETCFLEQIDDEK